MQNPFPFDSVKPLRIGPSTIGMPSNATARLAQSVEHETLNLRVVGSSPTLGVFYATDGSATYSFYWFNVHGRMEAPAGLFYSSPLRSHGSMV